MNPTRIDLLGEHYFLFSHTDAKEESCFPSVPNGAAVSLTPSLTADFCVKPCAKNAKQRTNDPVGAVCAAAHLSLVRGLPLDEFEFETPDGILKIFRTGDGFFALTIPKCKVLFTETAEMLGCEVRYTDVFMLDGVYRVVQSENASASHPSALIPLLSVGRYLPDAVLFFSVTEGELYILPYTDFNPSPPSSLLLFSAAAYAYGGRFGELSARSGSLFLRAGHSAVSVKIKCEIK